MTAAREDHLFQIRAQASRGLTAFCLFQCALLVPVGWLSGGLAVLPIVLGALVTAAVGLSYKMGPGLPANRLMLAVGQMLLVALLVSLFEGHRWQVDLHMYFFAVLALLIVLWDWRVIVAASLVVALHHLILNFALPQAVFPDGSELGRVLLHAVILIIEAAALIWVCRTLVASLASAEESTEKARLAQRRSEQLNEEKAEADRMQADQIQRAILAMADNVETQTGSVVEAIAQSCDAMAQSADGMAGAAHTMLSTASEVDAAADKAEGTMSAVFSDSEELARAVQAISSEVNHSLVATTDAVDAGAQTQATMEALSQGVDKIGDVATLIGDIASQTNLLALNATIEAARAGDAGRGFAVVASEVKNLAVQTAQSTEEITQLIGEIQTMTHDAVVCVTRISESLEKVRGVGVVVASAVEQQSAVTKDIVGKVEETTQTSRVVKDHAEVLRTGAGSSSQAVETLKEQVNGVVMQIHDLRSELSRIVRDSVDVVNDSRKEEIQNTDYSGSGPESMSA